MSELFKVASPARELHTSVLFVHGHGGQLYDTWRRGEKRTALLRKLKEVFRRYRSQPVSRVADDKTWETDATFWPLWLGRDCKNVAIYLIGYDAPISRLRGTAMHLTDQAANILARVKAEPALVRPRLIFIGHSLGGLVVKQLLRAAESEARYDSRAANLIERVEKVAFLATPHSGAGLASWGDRLRIFVRPSAATGSLVRNDPNLRDLNNWYRDWVNNRAIANLILTETKPTRILGMIVQPDSADPGLANVRPIPITADHTDICKPTNERSDIYVLMRDFIVRPAERPRVLQAESRQKRVAMMAPDPPSDFVQRPLEFDALKKQLLDAKGDAVAITAALRGAGGYGKTTLAKALAHDPEIQNAYFDGILWVELGERPEKLLAIISDLITRLTGSPPRSVGHGSTTRPFGSP
jgi:hypothetical protein